VAEAIDGKMLLEQGECRTLIFARLNQDDRKEATPGGIRTRDGLLESWPMLVTSLPQ
jgi:hypothetical protein